MWKSISAGVPARIRAFQNRSVQVQQKRCNQSTGGTPSATPKVDAQPPKAPIPETPKKKSGVLGKLFGISVVGVGGTLGYAWYDEDFRKMLENNVPISKTALDAVFVYLPDSPTIPAPILRDKRRSDLRELPSSGQAGLQDPPSLLKTKESVKEAPKEPDHELLVVKKKPETPQERKAREKEEALERKKEQEAEEKADNAALEIIVENLVEVCSNTVSQVLKAQDQLIEKTSQHKDLLKRAMEDSEEGIDKESQWQDVLAISEEREAIKRMTEPILNSARENLEKLNQAIEEGSNNKVTWNNPTLSPAKKTLKKLKDDLNKMEAKVSQAETKSQVLLTYKDLTDKAKKQFKQELESITPDRKLGDRKGHLTEEELNSLIVHAHRRIEQLQKQLARQIAQEEQKINQAMVEQQLIDEKVAEQRVRQERSKMDVELQIEKKRWDAEAELHLEQELRQQKVRDAAAHRDHLQAVINQTEKQIEKQYQRLLHKKLLMERNEFQREIFDWLARVRGIEAAVEGRAESEKIARHAQELWLACISLNSSIKVGKDGESPEQQLVPLAGELEKISDAASSHPYVQAVLRSIPQQAMTRGVWSEENLKERFPKVRRVAKRVAMIGENGGSLTMYFWSYLQSLLIFNTVQAKDTNDTVDLENFDNYQILDHANYWLQNGDIEQAVRFMNQLTGESRRVAEEWIQEARLHIEALQAAKALMAFASASGLGTLF